MAIPKNIISFNNDNLKRDPYRLVGSILGGQYRLLEYAGGGGMGAVYRCQEVGSSGEFALKILKPDIVANNPIYSELFAREVEAARQLKHPNIVNLIDSGSEDNISFLVMEWLNGTTLEDEIVKNPPDIGRTIDIFHQVCQAFAAAHEKKIIHLDIKPANIFLTKDGISNNYVKVIDFGLARIISSESGTTVTQFRGTHQYCSPEHYTLKVTHRSDIYSLGVLLYHLLTGVLPFSTSYIHAKMFPNLEMPPIPSVLAMSPDLPKALDDVILKALSRNPSERQQSVRQLFEEFLSSFKTQDIKNSNPREATTQNNFLKGSTEELTLRDSILDVESDTLGKSTQNVRIEEAILSIEKQYIKGTLMKNNNNLSATANDLGWSEKKLSRKMAECGLHKDHISQPSKINAWNSETIDGADYELIFKGRGEDRNVQVHEVIKKIQTGSTNHLVTTNAFPIEIIDLPLERQEAEKLIERYLSDLHPKTKELLVERLCAMDDRPEFRTY